MAAIHLQWQYLSPERKPDLLFYSLFTPFQLPYYSVPVLHSELQLSTSDTPTVDLIVCLCKFDCSQKEKHIVDKSYDRFAAFIETKEPRHRQHKNECGDHSLVITRYLKYLVVVVLHLVYVPVFSLAVFPVLYIQNVIHNTSDTVINKIPYTSIVMGWQLKLQGQISHNLGK